MNKKNYDYNTIEIGYYDKLIQKDSIQSRWHRFKFLGVKQILSQFDYKSLLDIACGPGTFLSFLPASKKTIGIDIAESQILYANEKYKTDNRYFKVDDVYNLSFNNESFDIITSMEFLEHITVEDAEKLLLEVKRCLKPNGYFIMTTPNYNSFWPFLEVLVSKFSKVDYTDQHISKYNIKKLRNLLLEANFEIEFVRSYLLFSPFFFLMKRKAAEAIFRFEFNKIKFGNLVLMVAKKKEN